MAVDHLRGDRTAGSLLASLIDAGGNLLASEVTRFELLAGARPGETPGLQDFFSVVDRVPVTEPVARQAGALAGRYLRSHRGIGAADFLIAATAVLLGAGLLTTNVRHFPMFPGLDPPY